MKRILIISLSLAVLLGVACKDPVAPEPTYYASSPVQCISYLEQAFNDRDISIFEKQLSPDFTFYFNEADVGKEVNDYTIPESWDYDHERRAVWNIFRPYDEGGAYDVSMQLSENDVGTPPEGATEYTASNIGISLLVMFTNTDGAIANKGVLDFTFEKTSGDNGDYWRLIEWKDGTYAFGEKTLEPMSLGEMKAYYYAMAPLPK